MKKNQRISNKNVHLNRENSIKSVNRFDGKK